MLSTYEHFLFLIAGVYRSVQKIERDEMVKYGYKGVYAQYLAAMKRYQEGVTSAQLCEICEKDKAAVSRAVKEMEEKGLIYRVHSGDTPYRARLKLTEKGHQAVEVVRECAKKAVEAAGKGLSDENRQTFYTVLELIAGNLVDMIRDEKAAQGRDDHHAE